ncbi:MAG: TlpA disulfide reductase family protein [Aureliella sp.]
MTCSIAGAQLVGAQEASEQLRRALSFQPRQTAVNYEQVDEADFGKCKIATKTRAGATGFWITGPAGQPLRWFADTDGDNKLDRWSFYNAGVEVYRESDTDEARGADEFRWLSTEGMRTGVDSDGDGEIDSWEVISAEEVTAEVVRATAAASTEQFERLLVTEEELKQLGLGEAKLDELTKSSADARMQFSAWAKGQNVVGRKTRWTHFGADKPGIVPAGTDGLEKDLVVYENVVALLDDGGEPRQLMVGTMVKVGEAWRLVDLPRAVVEGAELDERGRFFSATFSNRDASVMSAGGVSKTIERLVNELQDVDKKLLGRDGDLGELNAKRADVLEKLVAESPTENERGEWVRQLADTVNAAAQAGEYPGGVDRLKGFARSLKVDGGTEDEVAYVSYRALEASHRLAMLDAKEGEFEKLQDDYMASLERFAKEFPASPETADAITQIALAAEFSGDAKEAAEWYGKASRTFGDTAAGKKATGALRRLSLEGKRFAFSGSTVDGRKFDSTALLGKPVVYHCWANWCGSCKSEMRTLKVLRSKYAKNGLQLVGINFDVSDTDLRGRQEFLAKGDYPWVHVAEKGGLDGTLATYYGILTLPMNVVVDAKGQVVRVGVHSSEIDAVLDDLLDK